MSLKEPASEKSPENQREELKVAIDPVFPDGGLRAWLVVLGVCHFFPFAFILRV